MSLLPRLFQSSLGKKYLMAISGGVLLLFVIGHLAGNLQVFLGPEAINAYGHFLHSTPELLWGARLVLLTTVGLHLWSATVLTLENWRARPAAYVEQRYPAASYASRTMIWSGAIIAAFVVYHLLHYTAKVEAVNLTGKDFGAFEYTLRNGVVCADVYRMMVTGFAQPVVSGFYLLAVGLLCWHLSHGIGAMFQSLGLRGEPWSQVIQRGGVVIAGLLFAGYASIPVAVLLGYGALAKGVVK